MILFQALITALLSGLFSGAVLFGLNERRDRAENELRRLEDLFMGFSRWCDSINNYHWHVWAISSPDFEFHKFDQSSDELLKIIGDSWMNLDFLLDVWAPDIAAIVNPILDINKHLMAERSNIVIKKLNNTLKSDDFSYLTIPLTRLYEERKVALGKISIKARLVAARPQLLSGDMIKSIKSSLIKKV